MTRFVLLGSPFLGPEVWAPVAWELEAAGASVTAVAGSGDSPEEVLASLRAGLPDEPGVVLVPHSNAGLYVAALAKRRTPEAIVFVDALLPGPDATTLVTSAELAGRLDGLAVDGLLPGWTHWWPEDDVAGLFPDRVTREAVEAGQPQVRASYLRASVPTPPGWERSPCAYLGFGGAYADEFAAAERGGWPSTVLTGRHLHQLVDPAAVAAGITDLTQRLGRAG